MEKDKRNKMVLLVLLPVFVLMLIFRFSGSIKKTLPSKTKAKETVSVVKKNKKDKQIKAASKTLKDSESKIKKVEYKGAKFADPLKNKLLIYLAKIADKPAIKGQKGIEPPKLKISGLVWDSDRPQAIIEGTVLSIGDEIKEAKLLSVEKDGVKVEYKGFEFFIDK